MKIEEIKYYANVDSYLEASSLSPLVLINPSKVVKMDYEEVYSEMMRFVRKDQNLFDAQVENTVLLQQKRVHPNSNSARNFAITFAAMFPKYAKTFEGNSYPSNMYVLVNALKLYLESFPGLDWNKEASEKAIDLYRFPYSKATAVKIKNACEDLIKLIF